MIDFEADFSLVKKHQKSRAERAERFLIDYLALGSQPSVKLLADAKEAGISRSALSEARQILPIEVNKMPDGSWRRQLMNTPWDEEHE